MKKHILLVLLFVAAYSVGVVSATPSAQAGVSLGGAIDPDRVLAAAFENHQSDVLIQGAGRVVKILPDDVDGRRHQRFIVELPSGQTLLISHNIDLAKRIPSLAVGDQIEFHGEYEWSPKGGVIHWTHRDPLGSHAAGWLKHNGQIYQ